MAEIPQTNTGEAASLGLDHELLMLTPHDRELAFRVGSLMPVFKRLPEPHFTAIISSMNNEDAQTERTLELSQGSLAQQRTILARYLHLPGDHSLVVYAVLAGQVDVIPSSPKFTRVYNGLSKNHKDALKRLGEAHIYHGVQPSTELNGPTRTLVIRAAQALNISTPAEVVTIHAMQKQKEDRWIDRMRSATEKLATPRSLLGPRQQEVAGLVAQGLTSKQIGETLQLTEGTVSAHITDILLKLKLSRRTEIGPALVRSNLLLSRKLGES